ncbi:MULTISPECIES: hypothetical protein [Halomonadaceae]|uniref:hypothetical protein n=1 Tax=Halomonadaceae TaxID=28256 RepID=UPI001866FCD2|nr:hypothetical protein [Halomonas sp. 3F2F]
MSSSQRLKLPIGIQTFADIREDGYYYVDTCPWKAYLPGRNRVLQCRAADYSI